MNLQESGHEFGQLSVLVLATHELEHVKLLVC